jgi:flavin reductase (DIM6/NTAB) family NADH-FMN oxidoreductase RutF
VAILSTSAGSPHAIPVSTGVRAGPRLVLIALALRRDSLRRLREEPRAALTILVADDVAVTAHAQTRIVEDPMAVSDSVAAVALYVDRVQDHGQPRFTIEAGVKWRWTDDESRERDAVIREALARLGEQLVGVRPARA